jgi:radical SAM protein
MTTSSAVRLRPVAAAGVRHTRFDLGRRPFLVLFELTRACDLACRHCRAESVPHAGPDDLTTKEVQGVLDDLASLGPPRPRVVFTGGDPLKRDDLELLVEHAAGSGLSVAVSPAGTSLATAGRLGALRRAGAGAVSFSLDGGTASAHDEFRRVNGSFDWTLNGCRAARAAGLRLQVNTTVCAETLTELPAICRLVAELGAGLWSVFFLVPVGRGRSLRALSAEETEDTLAFLYDAAALVPLKTTEAPSFRRLAVHRLEGRCEREPGPLYWDLWRRLEAAWPESAPERPVCGPSTLAERPAKRRSPLSVGDGRGVVFVSHRGDVQPSGFLPLVAGNVRCAPLSAIYAGSPLLRALRDPRLLRGRCGRCELREVCGGSRAQAFARSGDPLGEDPTCAYDPPERAKAVSAEEA